MRNRPPSKRRRGSSLIEAVIAMGVLAIAIPLVFAAVAESGKTGISAEAETRSAWIVPACLREIEASRAGTSRYFPATSAGDTFPPGGGVWALGFAADGSLVGKMDKSSYDQGVAKITAGPVRYIASLAAEEIVPAVDPPMLRVRISLEYPSAAPAAKRRRLDFHTRIP